MPHPSDQVALSAEFFTTAGGTLVDVSSLTITISNPALSAIVGPTSVGITHVSTGLYSYNWTVPASASAGGYTVLWSGNSGQVATTELVTVELATAGAWCSVGDVLLFTGKTVTDNQLAQASAALELHIGRTYEELVANPDGGAIKIGRRDRQWLKQACAYQAAWMLAQPDMYQRLDMEALASSGRPITLKDRGLVLAPLARRAIQRVSWLRSRSLHARTPFVDGQSPISPNAVAEANDAYEAWQAIA